MFYTAVIIILLYMLQEPFQMPKIKFSLQLSFSLSFVVCSTVIKNNSDNLLKK